MSMQIRAGYLNPFSTKRQEHGYMETAALKSGSKKDPEELQLERQQLQNQLLLMKATGTDAANVSTEGQKSLEAELEAVTTALRTAKSEQTLVADPVSPVPKTDTYRAEDHEAISFGSYRLKMEKEGGYQILFSPFDE